MPPVKKPSKLSETRNLSDRRNSLSSVSSSNNPSNTDLFSHLNPDRSNSQSHRQSDNIPGEIRGNGSRQAGQERELFCLLDPNHPSYRSHRQSNSGLAEGNPSHQDASSSSDLRLTGNPRDAEIITQQGGPSHQYDSGFFDLHTHSLTETNKYIDELHSQTDSNYNISEIPVQTEIEIISPETLEQIKANFHPSLDAHLRNIFTTNWETTPHEILQILHNGQILLENSKIILNDVIQQLDFIEDKVNSIANQDIQENIQEMISEWEEKNPDKQEPKRETIHYKINVATREQFEHFIKLENVRQCIKDTGSTISYLYSLRFPTSEMYNSLQANIGGIGDTDTKGSLLLEITHLQQSIKDTNLYTEMQDTVKDAFSQKIQMDETMKKVKQNWELASLKHENLELKYLKGHHPFFPQIEMSDADAKIDVIPKGNSPDEGLAHMATTLLRAQKDLKADEWQIDEWQITQTLEMHPYGGGVDIQQLEDAFTNLGDKKGYKYRKIIELKDLETASQDLGQVWKVLETASKVLETALSKGPVGAFLHSPDFGNIAVVLERAKRNDITRRLEVVVHDTLRTANLKTANFNIQDFYTPHNDTSTIVPYKISVDILVQRGWTGGVFLPKAASEALDVSQ